MEAAANSMLVSSIVLLMVRLILTVTFIAESRHKLKDIKSFSKNDGVPVPVAYGVALAEGAAAISMLSGVLSRWAGLGLILLMIATTSLHIFTWHTPYWSRKGGWEYDCIMLVLAAVVVAFGPGQFALF
jgi:putative oxidoreductase